MALHVCSEPDCPELVPAGGYCDQHRRAHQRNRDQRRPSRHHRGYDARWYRTRNAYLRKHPRCEHEGCTVRAVEVHHIDGEGPLGPRGHDAGNLLALCKPHHSQRTGREQPSGTAAWRRVDQRASRTLGGTPSG